MSYATRTRESVYSWDNRGNLVIENAVIFWTNFQGNPTKFNPQGGKRTFCLGLDEDMADELRDDGWNVKRREPRDDQDDILYYTEIVLNMNSRFEPKVLLCSEWRGRKSMNQLHGDGVGKLDDLRFENVDLVIHPHRYGEGQAKGYCNVLAVTQRKEDLFGGKYDDYYDDLIDGNEDLGDGEEELPF